MKPRRQRPKTLPKAKPIQTFSLTTDLDNPDDFKSWYVYAIKCGPYYKIGISNDVAARRTILQIGNPFKISVIKKMHCPKVFCAKTERLIHKKLHQHHHRGEWFLADWQQVNEAIKGTKTTLRMWVEGYRHRTTVLEPHGLYSPLVHPDPEEQEISVPCEVRAAIELQTLRSGRKAERLRYLREIRK